MFRTPNAVVFGLEPVIRCICKECQKVKELSITQRKFNELKQTIEQAGFFLFNPQIELNCICETCYADAQ